MDKKHDEAILPEEMARVIDEQVRPGLHAHGGDLTVTEFFDGVLRFRLSGACHGCPSAWLTAEELVKTPLMEQFPQLKDVVADTDLDDGLIALAKELLSQKRGPS